jgi:hypothetical protein
MNSTIYNALNQCSTTGLERLVKSETMPDGKQIKLYKDHKGFHRIVLFLDSAPDSGVSGVIIQPDGEVYYKQTAPHAQGNGYTRMLQALLTVWGVDWYPSLFQTMAGAACYKFETYSVSC